MRRRTVAPVAAARPPRRLVEPYVEDYVQPGEDLSDLDVRRVPRSLAHAPLDTRDGMVEAAAGQRLWDARNDWQRSHGTTGLTVAESRAWTLGGWRPDDRERPGGGDRRPVWRDREAWLTADARRVAW